MIAGILGILLGIVLVVTRPNGILENRPLFEFLVKVINVVRSIPFIILLTLGTFTRFLVGTTIGETAALVPLIAGIIPFFARQIEIALLEVDPGVVEAEAMGTSPFGIIFRVYLPEGVAGIIRVSALTVINVIGLTAMAGSCWRWWFRQLSHHPRVQPIPDRCHDHGDLDHLGIRFISQFVSNLLIKRVSH